MKGVEREEVKSNGCRVTVPDHRKTLRAGSEISGHSRIWNHVCIFWSNNYHLAGS